MGKKVNKALGKAGKVLDPLGVAIHKKAGVPYGDPANLGGQIDKFMTPKMPGESQAEADLRARQAADLASLDEEENRRIKKLLSGARGVRGFRGGPLSRMAPSNTAGRVTTAAGSGSAGVGAINMRAGGGRGGLVGRSGPRSLIQ